MAACDAVPAQTQPVATAAPSPDLLPLLLVAEPLHAPRVSLVHLSEDTPSNASSPASYLLNCTFRL